MRTASKNPIALRCLFDGFVHALEGEEDFAMPARVDAAVATAKLCESCKKRVGSMFLWFLFAFCSLGVVYGVYAILRDNNRGRVQGRGFGLDRTTQPVGYTLLMTFNCVVVALLLISACVLGFVLLRRLMSG